MLTKGQKINDRYEIIKTIGEGGMANRSEERRVGKEV